MNRRVMHVTRWAICLIAFVSMSAGTLSAQNRVYHSPDDDGSFPSTAVELAIGPDEELFLYVDSGDRATSTGTPCNNGDGRELCGYSAEVEAMGGATFVDFVPQAGVVHSLTNSRLLVAGTFSLSPALGPTRIGVLRVASSQPGSEVMVKGGEAVLAALQIETIPQSIVATTPVPEPGLVVGLMAGVAWLAGRARSRHA